MSLMSCSPSQTQNVQDIVAVQSTESRILALSSTGSIYSVPIRVPDAESFALKTPASSWNPTTWLWGSSSSTSDATIIQLTTEESLNKNERYVSCGVYSSVELIFHRFISLSTGLHHALAVTTEGRTFAHPTSNQANAYGQLGLQRISDSSSQVLDLVPKAVADPYGRATAYARTTSGGNLKIESSEPSNVSREPFSDKLYEVPSLRGVRVAQAVAGARSSFVRTQQDGRVLAWGANEYGCVHILKLW